MLRITQLAVEQALQARSQDSSKTIYVFLKYQRRICGGKSIHPPNQLLLELQVISFGDFPKYKETEKGIRAEELRRSGADNYSITPWLAGDRIFPHHSSLCFAGTSFQRIL